MAVPLSWKRGHATGGEVPSSRRAPAGSSSGGHTALRALAVESTLAQPASVLLVDDPVRGLGPRDARRRVEEILAARPEALTVVALSKLELLPLFERVIALDLGRVVFDGPPSRHVVRDAPTAVHDARPEAPPTPETS